MQVNLEQISPPDKGRVIANLEISKESLDRIEHIHSETTPAERRYIYNFTSKILKGGKDIIEVGTYLGGTTRCIGLGLLDNPEIDSERHFSCDMFQGYHRPARLLRETEYLFKDSPRADEIREEIGERRWYKLFEELHATQDYGERLTIVEGKMPDLPGETFPDSIRDTIKGAGEFSLVFIDACKSWFATKALMIEVIDAMPKGCFLMHQDYGRHTCIWLSSFMAVFRQYFTLHSCVSGTYTFVYRGGLTREKIEADFPDQPDGFSTQDFDQIFSFLHDQAVKTSDVRAAYTYIVQRAGCMAYLGHIQEARHILSHVDIPAFALFQDTTDSALITPTFAPQTPIYLIKPPK